MTQVAWVKHGTGVRYLRPIDRKIMYYGKVQLEVTIE